MSVQSPRLAVSTAYSAANYLPATLKTNKSGWIIEYYVENPQTQILARKMIRLQRLLKRYPSKMDARRHINNIIVALNMKLSTGWNPYFMGEDSRMYTPIKEVTKKYLEEIKRNIRPDSCRLYTSFLNIFCDWLEKVSPNIYSSMVTHTLVYHCEAVPIKKDALNGLNSLFAAIFYLCRQSTSLVVEAFCAVKKRLDFGYNRREIGYKSIP